MNHYNIIALIRMLFDSEIKQLETLTYDFFDDNKSGILQKVMMFLPDVRDWDDLTLNTLYTTARNEYLSVNPIEINPSGLLVKEGFQTWLTDERKNAMPKDYIDRYLKFLRQSGRSERVINEIERSSEKILEKLGDPRCATGFYCKGLVVGSVQSGKTGNFNAVINRAIDAGYSLIIVLSGIMEDLRSQTQDRIESDVVGEGVVDKLKDRKDDKGVGKIRRFGEQGDANVRQVFTITSYKADFKKSVKESDFSLNNKNILVCKKNTGVLKNLLLWLSEYLRENKEQHNIPLLIIDDEADNASLNNLGHKGKEYASTINGHIRALLRLFSKKTYLGYTATPFANVLQDRNEQANGKWPISYKQNGDTVIKEFDQVDNIFPDDFIELLIPPTNYVGARHIFETVLDPDAKKIPLLVQVEDAESAFPTHVTDTEEGITRPATRYEILEGEARGANRNDAFPAFLPKSLEEAIQCFILGTAVRLSRKPDMINSRLYNPHNTMLVHVSRFIPWQNTTKRLIGIYVQTLENRILNDLPGSSKSIYRELEKTWNKYYAAIITDIRSYLPQGYQDEFLIPRTFSEIEPLLVQSVKGIEVKAVNSETKDKLEYNTDSGGNGKKYIAVGGNRLSRGFTLEGLTINYFIRNTNFSDALLQMGRWFGYRPGYVDCCKLFTTADAIEKYDTATKTMEELEVEFLKMDRAGKQPRDFILRVRKDPGTLKITRPAILRNTDEVNWSYQDKLEQPTKFRLEPILIASAWADFKKFVGRYEEKFVYEKGFYMFHTDASVLLELLTLKNTFYDYSDDINQIRVFIERCLERKKLKRWTIAIKAGGAARPVRELDKDFPFAVTMTQRSGPEKNNNGYRTEFVNRHVFSVSGKSANIVSSGADLSILLSEEEINEAKREFEEERIEMLQKKNNMTIEEARERLKASGVTYPERIYRERMSDDDGLLLIYLQDLKHVFRQENGGDEELKRMAEEGGFNLNIPLIGYAFGFPPISPDPGGTYAVGRYGIEEPYVEEFDEALKNEED